MYTVKRIIAGTLAGAALVIAPAVALAGPASASPKEDPSLVAAEHDAQQSLTRTHRDAGMGVLHAQSDVIHVTQAGNRVFKDDAGHTMTFHHDSGADRSHHA